MDDAGVAAVTAVLNQLGLPSGLLSPLVAHAEAVATASPRLGLVSTGDEAVVLQRHTADSLVVALARVPQPEEHWVDVGSGGGFPGLPLAICYPQTRFTLVEANGKKAGFLEMQVLDLGLTNTQVVAGRAERQKAEFDVAVSRALAEPTKAMNELFGLVKAGGECLVSASEPVSGARVVRVDLPEVDSPCCLSMMTAGEDL